MSRRGFKPSCEINLEEFPTHLVNDWTPSIRDSKIIRERIKSKLILKPNYYRYQREKVNDIYDFIHKLENSNLYRV